MVLGSLIRVIFGAIIGFVVGFILSLFPSFSNAITDGIHAITGADLSGQIIALMTGLGFLFGLISAVFHEMGKR
jgi:ABC-type polysaccharide/polyol phosphate export permease